MINFDFEFVRAATTEMAVKAFHANGNQNKMYVSGATEFISRARMCEVTPHTVIDTKFIPECNVLEERDGNIIIGSAVPLNKIIDANHFPLLTDVCRGIASRTARNKITLGGNLLSHLPYKETMLPLLLANSQIVVATTKGMEKRYIKGLSDLAEGELLLQIITDKDIVNAPYQYKRKTRQSDMNYPIITAAAISVKDKWRFAFSGLSSNPFRAEKLEEKLATLDAESTIGLSELVDDVPGEILDDLNASRAFRTYLFRMILNQIIIEGGEES